MTSPRSNSFNFTAVADVARAPGRSCPLRQAGAPSSVLERADPARGIFVRLRDRMRLYRTETRDFTDTELSIIKEELGQVYADVSSKLAPDDFAKDLKKLVLEAECTTCERRPACSGCFRMRAEDVFSRDDARVREILRSLAGTVLDVGCGEGSYLSELEGGVQAGRVRYLGLDPDPERVSLLRSRYAWAEYAVGTLDDLGERATRFDHVVFLRSYNHLSDPDRALELVLGRLGVGGTLLIVDNVAFGLVRSREHAARAEASSAAFEHYRNESSELAHARVAGRPLRLLERSDVGRRTGNQWLLRYERTSDEPADGAS